MSGSHSVCVSVSETGPRQSVQEPTQRWIREQTALTKGSLSVTLTGALRAPSRSHEAVPRPQRICSDDSRDNRCF